VRLERADLVEVVLEPDRQAALVRLAREEAVEAQLVGGAQREAAAVRVAVDVVGLARRPTGRPRSSSPR
jgi:hypothetical protein